MVITASSSWWLVMEIWISIRRQTWRNNSRSSSGSSPAWFPSATHFYTIHHKFTSLQTPKLASVGDSLKRRNFTKLLNLFMFACCRGYEVNSILVLLKGFDLVFDLDFWGIANKITQSFIAKNPNQNALMIWIWFGLIWFWISNLTPWLFQINFGTKINYSRTRNSPMIPVQA